MAQQESSLYRHKCASYEVKCGIAVSVTDENVRALKDSLDVKLVTHYPMNALQRCVICDEACTEGQFAVENALFLPNKTHTQSESATRFRAKIPRVCCHECASDYAKEKGVSMRKGQGEARSVLALWNEYNAQGTQSSDAMPTKGGPMTSSAATHTSAMHASASANTAPIATQSHVQTQQMQPQVGKDAMKLAGGAQGGLIGGGGMLDNGSDRDPFEDGFLICTQLVKTGGADQGGLQVGDVFVKFGSYDKSRFPGLKSIANLVRRSAGKEINVVVWRKLETTQMDDGESGRTVYQKLALKLKPLQSHDADGGGVLGSVINTYPLPSAVQ